MKIRDLSGWTQEYRNRYFDRWREGESPPTQRAVFYMHGPWPQRGWINQPSTLQRFHALHGRRVLVGKPDNGWARIWFTEGPITDQDIEWVALSPGWPSSPNSDED